MQISLRSCSHIHKKKLIYIVLIFFLISLFFSYLLKDEQWYSSLFQILASTALAVLVTLRVIEASLKRDKERQWKATKILTYMTILEAFRDIFTYSYISSGPFFVAEDEGNEMTELFNEISANRGNVAVTMVKCAILIKKGYIKGDRERYRTDASEYIKTFKNADKEMKKRFVTSGPKVHNPGGLKVHTSTSLASTPKGCGDVAGRRVPHVKRSLQTGIEHQRDCPSNGLQSQDRKQIRES